MRLPERGLRWSIRSIEWMRRLIGGIKEFGDNPDAVFRLAIGKADRVIRLSDGNTLQPGDAVGELHLWNEHLLLVSVRRPDLRWAVTMRRRATQSLRLLAAHLLSDHRFDDVKALYIQPASVGGRRAATLNRILARYGFEVNDEANTSGAAIMVIPLWRQFLAVDDSLDLQPRPQSGRLAVRPAARRVLDLSCALHRPIWKQRRK